MADDSVDISGMPDPGTIGLAPPDPTSGMPEPAALYKQHHGYDASSPEEVAEFMRNPDATPAVRNEKSGRYGASMLTGLPRAAAGYAAAVPAGVASIAGQASGALGAALDPDNASDYLAQGRDRGRAWAAKVNNLANYVPATAAGADAANALMAAPSDIIKGTAGAALQATLPDNAYQAVSDVAQDVGTDLPALGAPGVLRAGARAAGKVAGAAKGALTDIAPEGTTYDAAGTAVAPSQALTAPVDPPVTGDTLRAQPNPIPAPEGTIHSQVHPASLAPEAAGAAPKPSAPAPTFESPDATPVGAPTEPQAPPESPATQGSAETAPTQAPPPLAAAGETPPTGAATLPDTDSAPLDMSLSPDERALVREGVAARRAASDSQRGSAQLFSEPTKTGPQATPEPAQQSARAQSLDDIDKLSGGMLPSRRASAISGDYNATGDDYQLKEVGSEPMRQQLASENSALHAAAENVHQSVGSQFSNSVDPQTVSDRGRVTRGAIQGIQGFFQKSTDESYDAARASSGDKPMPNFLGRVDSFLKDDANYMPEGFRRSAQARLQQLKTAGDNGIESGSAPAAPSSVAAAEKFREWLNANRTLDNMHTVRQMVDRTDTDVAEHGGPGLFQTARDMRRHQYKMLEEPTGIKKLLAPADSQGINHAIPEHKVMDYIADLPREQHEHVLNVLRAGAHLGGGELANDSAGAIREIQAHMVSRMHDAATNADGTWNARKFYNQASSYAPKLGDTFRDQPKTRQNLQTINRAGNTLSMDKHYPGAAAQAERTGLGAATLKGAGNIAASVAHEIPVVGRLVGRGIEGAVEGMSEKGREAARDKAAMSRLVDRTGKQRGSVQLFNDNDLNQGRDRDSFHGKFVERNPRTEYNANSQLAGGRQRLTAEQNDIIGRLGGGKQRGAVGDLSQRDAVEHDEGALSAGTKEHTYRTPSDNGFLRVTETPGRGITQGNEAKIDKSMRGQGWGTRMLQRAVDDTHSRGQVWHSDKQVSDGQAGAYSNLKKLGYDVTKKDADHSGGAYHAVGDHVFEVRPGSNEYRAPKELEDFIKKSAPAHRVDPNGPSNWEELQARRNEKVMPINPQGGEGSIYKDVPTNMAFRAWHDKTHLDVNGGFDHDGELATAKEQLRQAKAAGLSDEAQRALWADTWETFKHHEDTGEFPKSPRQFVAQRMQDKTPLGERVAASKQRGAVGDLGKKEETTFIRHAPARVLDKTRDLAEDVGERMHGFDQDVMDKATEAHDYLRHLPKRIVNKARDIGEDVGERLHGFDQDVMDKATEAHDYLRHLPKRIADKARDIGENVGERFIGADQDMMDKATELRDRAERMVGIRERNPRSKQRGSVRVTNDKPSEEKGGGSMLNIGLHQGQEGEKGFRKMSKQEAAGAVESTGAKVTRSSVLTPDTHGVAEPTLVASTDRALSNPEMQKVLAKTKQSAIPQRTDAGETSMHVAPGHEEIAKREGWDTFNPDYFREHNGQSMSEAGEGPPAKRYPASPDATVKNPTQSKFPGIYDDPKEIMNRLGAGAPESPHMKDIFGVTRKDLHDATLARGDVEPKTPIPGITPKGKGSMHANRVMTPENAERIRSTIQAYKEHDPSGYHGMVGWYEMDPMFKSIKKILGGDADRAGDVYHKLNSYTSYASPMSSVDPEIRRGAAAATMAAEGNFDKFYKHGGKPQLKAPAALKAKNFELGNEGHAMHSTAHAGAMTRFNEYGEEARAVKTGTYRRSSDAPSRTGSEYQNTVPVGDSHWSRGVGLADVRGAAVFEGSAEGPEMKVLAPWYRDQIARHPDIDLPSTSAQAVQWGALSRETGVDSPVGAPKLELWANQIADAAKRAGTTPKEMWQRIVKRLAK